MRIGVFLEANPADGGIYRYSRQIALAMRAISSESMPVVLAHTTPAWSEIGKGMWVSHCRLDPTDAGALSKVALRAWTIMGRPHKIGRTLFRRCHPLARQMRKLSCDLWLFPGQEDYSFLLGLPSLAVIHDLMHRYESRFPELGDPRESKRRDILYSGMCKWAKGVLAESEVGKSQIIESYDVDAGKVHILPYTVVGDPILDAPEVDIRAKYGLPNRFIFYPAQFWPHKNHVNLIRAIKIASKDNPDMHLVLTGGDKGALSGLKKEINSLGIDAKISILGLVPDIEIPSFFRKAAFLAMVTACGPTNIPPLEAITLQCPVVCSSAYAMPWQLQDAAIYFDPDAPEDIAQAISRMWNDEELRERCIRRGADISREWTDQHFAERLREILLQVSAG